MRTCLLLACLALLAGCGTTRPDYSSPLVDASPAEAAPQPVAPGAIAEAPLESADLRIQRAGIITLDVKDGMSFSGELRKHAGTFEAVVMNFSDREVAYRMPSSRLDALLEWLAAQDPRLVELESFDFSALDRTGEFYSVEGRLAAAKAARDRSMELFKMAQTIAEIERIEARLEVQQQRIDTLESTLFDIKLRAGRVEVRLRLT